MNVKRTKLRRKNTREYGHFERDTIIRKKQLSTVVTRIEKRLKYPVLLKVSPKSTNVKQAIINWLESFPDREIKTSTFD